MVNINIIKTIMEKLINKLSDLKNYLKIKKNIFLLIIDSIAWLFHVDK